ncbi:PREDICTED: uncharacterized protein LOC106314755 [Brassica oleracea var. oleracea]|uniref:uncharacterized protein LOC106314755 n=1 Tax=Brassica oleracea var. oleracea TaxID=109376 RepID=UPI0006A6FE92|nr:PREDICTED: uncharacterized protein LOC106314755 [Brassica oleracea var. oleracea]
MEHIEAFEEICSFTRANGVPPDYNKCMVFPFSLADKASRWLKSLPTGSLTYCEQVRAAFLGHFYTKAKTAALRNKISSFKQLANEPFNEAWERFNDTLRDCPHHGFDDDHVLGIFYDDVKWEFCNGLNAVSNGDFMTQTTEGAHALIENMAASSSNKNEETDRSKKVNSINTRKIDDLAAKVNLLLKNNQNHIYVMEETNLEPGTTVAAAETETSEEDQQEVSYVNGQGWQFKNYHPNPNVRNNPHLFSYKTNPDNPNDRSQGNQFQNTGYQKPYFQNQNQNHNQNGKMFILSQAQNQFQNRQNNPQAAPATTSGPPYELKGMMQQLMQASHIKQMDVEIAQTAETIKRQQGTLPGKTDKNRKDCNAVELRSGRHLSDPVPKKLTAQEKGKQKEGEQPPLEDVHDDHESEQPTAA